MQRQEFELSVGDALRIGNRVLTVIDLENGEVAFRIDDVPYESSDCEAAAGFCPPGK